jgi:hypothetical protein
VYILTIRFKWRKDRLVDDLVVGDVDIADDCIGRYGTLSYVVME